MDVSYENDSIINLPEHKFKLMFTKHHSWHLFTIVNSSLRLKVRPLATHINPKTNKNKYESNNRRKDQRLRPQINTLLLQNVLLIVTTLVDG